MPSITVEIRVKTGAKSSSSQDGVWFEYSGGSPVVKVSPCGDIDISENVNGAVDLVFILDEGKLEWPTPAGAPEKYNKLFHTDGRKSVAIADTKSHFEKFTVSPDRKQVTVRTPKRDGKSYKYELSFMAENGMTLTHDPQIKNGGNNGFLVQLSHSALAAIGLLIGIVSYVIGYLSAAPP